MLECSSFFAAFTWVSLVWQYLSVCQCWMCWTAAHTCMIWRTSRVMCTMKTSVSAASASSNSSTAPHHLLGSCQPNTHTHTTVSRPFGPGLPGRPYQKRHSPTHTHPDHQTSLINFLCLLWSIASSVFSLRAWQFFSTTSLQVLFGLGPSTSYSMHFFTQSSSSFCSTCPYQRSLFCCNTNAMSSVPNLCLSSLLTVTVIIAAALHFLKR